MEFNSIGERRKRKREIRIMREEVLDSVIKPLTVALNLFMVKLHRSAIVLLVWHNNIKKRSYIWNEARANSFVRMSSCRSYEKISRIFGALLEYRVHFLNV